MNFSEQPPSTQWQPLRYRGEPFAAVWFKPEGEPFGLTFRIPQSSFQIPGMDQGLTTENLLRSVGLATEEVESWRYGDVSHAGMDGSNPELKQPVPPPSPDAEHLDLYIRLRPPIPGGVADENSGQEVLGPRWEDLEARWNLILGLEANIDALRLTLEGVRVELETAWGKTLTPEEKHNALRADVAQWTKEKNRVHFALPKLREFVHRATWAMGLPERKQLGELFDGHKEADGPLPEMDRVPDLLEYLLKERQILCGQGQAVLQECRNLLSDIQRTLSTLQSNAAANAKRKRDAARAGSKFFKDVRRLSMGGGG